MCSKYEEVRPSRGTSDHFVVDANLKLDWLNLSLTAFKLKAKGIILMNYEGYDKTDYDI